MLIVATPLGDVDSTLHRLLLIELLVTSPSSPASRCSGSGCPPRPAPARRDRRDRGGDRGRRPLAPRRARGRAHRGRPARAGAQRDARPDRDARSARARRPSGSCAGSSPTPRTSCARRSRRCAPTPSCSRAAPPSGRTTSRGRWRGSRRESERMSVLVDDLLLLARLDEGRPLEREPVELDDVVGRGGRDGAHASSRSGRSTCRPRAGDRARRPRPPAAGGRQPARQRPRAHAGRQRRVDVRRRARRTAARCSTVADTGPGLDAEQAQQVFERFYRADASRARASGGVGLGLAIVAAVAEAHGGRATAARAPGGGATFSVELPLAATS